MTAAAFASAQNAATNLNIAIKKTRPKYGKTSQVKGFDALKRCFFFKCIHIEVYRKSALKTVKWHTVIGRWRTQYLYMQSN